MATIGYSAPTLVGSGNIKEPKPFAGQLLQGAAWRRGDIVINATTGSITNPPSVSVGANLLNAAAPTAANVAVIQSAVAGAPAATYFYALTYTATSQETLPLYGLINCSAGNVPSLNVLAANAPAGATNFAAYVGIYQNSLSLQQATKTTTALGTPFVCTNPLTNNTGWNRAATNASANIVGLAQSDSNATFVDGVGGSFLAGGAGSRLGSTNTLAPGAPSDAGLLYVTGLGYGQEVEMNLVNTQVLSQNLLYTTAGITLDATTGFFVVDPSQSNKIFTITRFLQGVAIGPTASGTFGDLGARIVGYFNSGLLLQ